MTALLLLAVLAAQEIPVPVDDRLAVELVTAEPDLVTPTAVACDALGRVWVIESNTHFRPEGYDRHPSDRILIFHDFGPDGRARKVSTFADGFTYGMGLSLRPGGDVFFATRREIRRLRDTDDDGTCDERTILAELRTEGNYPHNGLSGFAFDLEGRVYFGLGENLGVDYELVGADGTTLKGGGEGGNIYRCGPDGTGLERIATGFWNPFHLCFDAFGRLFAIDNDPDSRPPNRLLHIVPGGDYGYRFRNGRKGLHPFTAWDGELPGTLPMAAGTAEGVSGVLAYESDGLPEDYRGTLLTTSWGDHVIQRFRLERNGASVKARGETIVRGTENFRPVGIALAPDGSVILSDWVDRSYRLHGKGRLWRIRAKDRPDRGAFDRDRAAEYLAHPRRDFRERAGRILALHAPALLEETLRDHADPRARLQALRSGGLVEPALKDPSPEIRAEAVRGWEAPEEDLLAVVTGDPSKAVRMAAVERLANADSLEALLPLLADGDPFLRSAAIDAVARIGDDAFIEAHRSAKDPGVRLGILLAARRRLTPFDSAWLEDPDPGVRRAAIQWVGEAGLRKHRGAIEAAASRTPVTPDVFEAFLAAADFLNADSRTAADKVGGEFYLLRVLGDGKRPVTLRALALRMLRPDHPTLTVERLRAWLEGSEPEMRLEAARLLSERPDEAAQAALRRVARDHGADAKERRLEAIRGLALVPAPETTKLLLDALGEDDPDVRRQALRSLGPSRSDAGVRKALESLKDARAALLLGRAVPGRPDDAAGWRKALAEGGDPAEGARVFFHPAGPQCYVCHRVNGRGGEVGPDLSTIGRTLDRLKLVDSILEPSREIAPMFVGWKVATTSGQVVDGRLLRESPGGDVTLIDAKGKIRTVKAGEIRARKPSELSLMPAKLWEAMTVREFRDLVAFLESRR